MASNPTIFTYLLEGFEQCPLTRSQPMEFPCSTLSLYHSGIRSLTLCPGASSDACAATHGKCMVTLLYTLYSGCRIKWDKMQLTIRSLLVKWTIQPSLITFDPRRLVCFTDCTMRINGILLLGDELSTSNYTHITHISYMNTVSSSKLCFYSSESHYAHPEHKLYIYRVSRGECARLHENVPYVKVHRSNPKHLYPKLNSYRNNGQRKVWSSCGSMYCTCSADALPVHCTCPSLRLECSQRGRLIPKCAVSNVKSVLQ